MATPLSTESSAVSDITAPSSCYLHIEVTTILLAITTTLMLAITTTSYQYLSLSGTRTEPDRAHSPVPGGVAQSS